MSSAAQKWLIGCGCGCLAIVLLLAAAIAAGVFVVKDIVEEFEGVSAVMDDMTERYGKVSDFRPDPDGAIRPERIEAFLAVREAMVPTREEMNRSLALLSGEKERGSVSPGRVFGMIRAGLGLIPGIADFLSKRNEALLEADMGLGEYYYIYTIAYYSWLGNSPSDGPPFTLMGGDGDDGDDAMDEFEVREVRLERTLGRLNELLLPMLRHQLDDLEQARGGDTWRRALVEEIEAMDRDAYRLPWRDELPEVLRRSLEPYRERLESSYSALCNPIEVALEHH